MAGTTDIFLSYTKSDLARAEKVANALQKEGLSVWWDHKIRAGKNWPDVIEQSIKNSRCVLVLWSANSINAKWVKKEARFADKLDRLVPALIDAVEPPFEFEHIQAADLINWDGVKTTAFIELVEELQARVHPDSVATEDSDEEELLPAKKTIPAHKAPAPRARVQLAQPVSPFPEVKPNPIRKIGLKNPPSFWASSTGSLLKYLSTIAIMWAIGILASYLAMPYARAVHISASSSVVSWAANFPVSLTLIVESAIIVVTWMIADDEVPIDVIDYAKVSAKATGFALVCSMAVIIVLGSLLQMNFLLRNFAFIAVSTAGASTSIFAVMDELF